MRTAFREVIFKDCKMFGLSFSDCNEFGLDFSFENCALNNSSFYKTDIRKTSFKNCQLIEVDFEQSDLSQSILADCDCRGAIFMRTSLIKTDFRSSFNYTINPEKNKLKKARFSLAEITGLLQEYDITIEK